MGVLRELERDAKLWLEEGNRSGNACKSGDNSILRNLVVMRWTPLPKLYKWFITTR